MADCGLNVEWTAEFVRRETTSLFMLSFCVGSEDDSANGTSWEQCSRVHSSGDLAAVGCFSLIVQLPRATSSVFLIPAAAVVRQRLVQEFQVIEYVGSIAHFHKLNKMYLCPAYCSSDCMN